MGDMYSAEILSNYNLCCGTEKGTLHSDGHLAQGTQ